MPGSKSRWLLTLLLAPGLRAPMVPVPGYMICPPARALNQGSQPAMSRRAARIRTAVRSNGPRNFAAATFCTFVRTQLRRQFKRVHNGAARSRDPLDLAEHVLHDGPGGKASGPVGAFSAMTFSTASNCWGVKVGGLYGCFCVGSRGVVVVVAVVAGLSATDYWKVTTKSDAIVT